MSGAILAGLLVGSALGGFNGFVIMRFGLPPFVATLGMLSIARGLTMLWTGGFPITRLGESFGQIGSGYWLGLPMPVWMTGALVALVLLEVSPLWQQVIKGIVILVAVAVDKMGGKNA